MDSTVDSLLLLLSHSLVDEKKRVEKHIVDSMVHVAGQIATRDSSSDDDMALQRSSELRQRLGGGGGGKKTPSQVLSPLTRPQHKLTSDREWNNNLNSLSRNSPKRQHLAAPIADSKGDEPQGKHSSKPVKKGEKVVRQLQEELELHKRRFTDSAARNLQIASDWYAQRDFSFWERVLLHLLRRVRLLIAVALVMIVFVWCKEMRENLPAGLLVEESSRPGLLFNKSSIRQLHPVVLVPGFITTALELWEGEPCSKMEFSTNFRQRMFSPQMLLTLLRDPECFLRHFSLDAATGGDPPGIRVRPDSSFSSADYLVFGFWVWAKMLINLADIGLDPNRMYLASYDWRLNAEHLEARDLYFSKMKVHMELNFNRNNEKFVIIGHSYGSNIIQEFLVWVDDKVNGWVERHVEAFIDIGGPLMGLPKAVAGLVSGEVKDTAMLPMPLRRVLDSHFEKNVRTKAFRSWLCLSALLPRGSDCAWPRLMALPSSSTDADASESQVIDDRQGGNESLHALEGLLRNSSHTANAAAAKFHIAHHYAHPPRLPKAPSMTVYCIYGVGRPSESGYWFTAEPSIDTERGDNASWVHPLYGAGQIASGVELVDGDGTVPLVSLGYPCRSTARGFSQFVKRVVTKEYEHSTPLVDVGLRGGTATADHVDIMGNYDVIRTVLNVVAGNGDKESDAVTSGIDGIVQRIDECMDSGRTTAG